MKAELKMRLRISTHNKGKVLQINAIEGIAIAIDD